ncbi:hypothetical protein BH23GEM11_BH23GEM11_01910 [soil metagenome]
MRILTIRSFMATVAALVLIGMATPATAQGPPYQQVISANPFGLLLEFFNAEYERVVTVSSTAGIGGSTISSGDDRYVNVDAFWRYYPSGVPFDGWAFGSKVGLTSVTDQGTYFGFGFDVNRSWLLGAQENFYVGIGFGLKRILGSPDEVDLKFVPTIRLVNVGFAF